MANENMGNRSESIFSQRVRAGKRRTYFIDVRETKGKDYYLTITESRKKFNEDGYDRHKIFLYKEDFNKFLQGLTEVVDYVKTELLPDFDFDSFSHDDDQDESKSYSSSDEGTETTSQDTASDATESSSGNASSMHDEEADTW